MPLIHSGSRKAVSKNISTEIHAGKPRDQAVAIAMSVARRAHRAEGGRTKKDDGIESASKASKLMRDAPTLEHYYGQPKGFAGRLWDAVTMPQDVYDAMGYPHYDTSPRAALGWMADKAGMKKGGKVGGGGFVRTLQQQLANKGYYDGKVDGVAGKITRAAILQFQKDNGLRTTGTATAETMAELKTAGGKFLPTVHPDSLVKTAEQISKADERSPLDRMPERSPLDRMPSLDLMGRGRGPAPPVSPAFVSADKEFDPNVNAAAASNRKWDEQMAAEKAAWDVGQRPPIPPPVRQFTDQGVMATMPGLREPQFTDQPGPAPMDEGALQSALLRKQALATAYRAAGGSVQPRRFKAPHVPHKGMGSANPYGAVAGHTGGLLSDVAGRTDHIPLDVPNGAYVIPADVVSGLGQGNTIHGTKVLTKMFHRHRRMQPMTLNRTGMARAAGGVADKAGGPTVPINAAGGEFVIDPNTVAQIGEGDISHGHDILDKFVTASRKRIIGQMKKLPPPVKE